MSELAGNHTGTAVSGTEGGDAQPTTMLLGKKKSKSELISRVLARLKQCK